MLCAAALTPALAEKADRSKPLTIEADQPGSVDLLKQVVVFNGNVVVTQGTMAIRADRVEVRERPDGYRIAIAVGSAGKPAVFRQKRDGVDETIEGEAERIEYDSRGDVVRFVGNAQVRRLRGATRGRRDQRQRDHLRQRQRDLQRAGGAAAGQPGGRRRTPPSRAAAACG